MKIAVLIPSLNEADTISKVVHVADEGLCIYFPKQEAIIVNIDGTSSDGTKAAFLRTKTRTKKLLIDNSKNKIQGKGSNILRGLRFAVDKFDSFLLLDADVQSIDPSWIKKLLKPIVNGQADLVCPIYTRNRYEGNTTNHFSAPLLRSCLRININQPIAGDFGVSKKLAQKIVVSFSGKSDYQYGIDTLISWSTAGLNLPICQVKLGKKIHKPSFPKIIPMFRQVCETTFCQIIRFKKEILVRRGRTLPSENHQIVIDASFMRKPEEKKINDLEKLAWEAQSNLNDINFGLLSKFLNHRSISIGLWSDFLSQVIGVTLNGKSNARQLGKLADLTTPIYLLRVVNYMRSIENLDNSAVADLLEKQSEILDKKLSKTIASVSA